nr:MAG TPA: hypothetical protein [Caudoviricetes sp.]
MISSDNLIEKNFLLYYYLILGRLSLPLQLKLYLVFQEN